MKTISFILALSLVGCGVRGDPVPPKTERDLGRGHPTYKGVTEDLKIPNVPPVYAPREKKEEEKGQ